MINKTDLAAHQAYPRVSFFASSARIGCEGRRWNANLSLHVVEYFVQRVAVVHEGLITVNASATSCLYVPSEKCGRQRGLKHIVGHF